MNVANKLGNPEPKRVIILRALQLGDLLCAVPAFRALRSALPDAVITLVGLPWARSFVERFNYYLDDFIEFPGFPGFPERAPQIDRFPAFISEIQWLEFDLSIQMQGSGGIANSLIELFGARRNAGFYLPGQYCPDDELFLSYPVHEPEVWRHLRLMEFLGFELEGDDLEFPIYAQDWAKFHLLKETYGLQPGQYACVHPGSRAHDRRWSIDRFAAVADGLAERGLRVVLTGTHEESHLTAAVANRMLAPMVDLAGLTDLGTMAALISSSRVLVCNDTGVSHIAAALRTPSVVLFSASDPERWAPRNQVRHRIVAWASAAIPGVVLAEVDALLHREQAYA